jgi:hypothetical protein
MANEITINLSSITYVKDVYNDTLPVGIVNVTVTGKHAVHDNQQLTVSNAPLGKGNIGTIGFFYVKNKDTTINVLVSMGTVEYMTLPPGGIALGVAGVANINAKGASGSPNLEYWLIEA